MKLYFKSVIEPKKLLSALCLLLAMLLTASPTFAQEQDEADDATSFRERIAEIQEQASRTAEEDDPKEDADDEATEEAVEESAPEQPVVEDSYVGWMELSGPLRQGPVPFAWMSAGDAQPTLGDLVGQLDYVASEEDFLGVVMYLNGEQLSLSEIHGITQAVHRVRDSGKTVVAVSEAYELRSYLLASAADMIVLQHKGMVELNGLMMEEMYLAGMLDKIGVKADLMQVGQYKGADEAMTRTEPSEPWNENIDALLDDMYLQIVETIARQRGLSVEGLEKLMAQTWSLDDVGLVRAGLVDRLSERDLISVTELEYGEDFVWDVEMGLSYTSRAMPNNPFAIFQMLFNAKPTNTTKSTIAVIHGDGPIHGGRSTIDDGMFSDASIGAQTWSEALDEALNDPNIKGVVLRLDSPGGSALASEMIWQAVREVGNEKPVYASVDHLAASGGYYIISAADKVYLSPQSIVGSIGVVGGKLTLGGLYEWAGINVKQRVRGPLGGMFNSVEPFNDEERAAVLSALERIYDQFLDRVEIGRGNRIADVNSIAEGRLFTGRQATTNGMADELKQFDEVVKLLAKDLELTEGHYDVLHLPRPITFQEFLDQSFGFAAKTPNLMHVIHQQGGSVREFALLQRLVGPRHWNMITQQLSALMLLHEESALTVMPNAILIR